MSYPFIYHYLFYIASFFFFFGFILVQERGVESLLDLLCDFNTGYERVQGEAAGVVAQLTSPGLQNGHNLPGLLENLYRLLQALLSEQMISIVGFIFVLGFFFYCQHLAIIGFKHAILKIYGSHCSKCHLCKWFLFFDLYIY